MTLHEFNILPKLQLVEELTRCCSSKAWVERMLPFIPAEDMVELLEDAEQQWWLCSEKDWREAFSHHPRIGDINSLKEKFASTAEWAGEEQKEVGNASLEILEELKKANEEYEKKFGYTFIVCASGRSAAEILSILHTRLQNSAEVEIEVAADEQNSITKLRLQKLLE